MKSANEFRAAKVFSRSERERLTAMNIFQNLQTTLADFEKVKEIDSVIRPEANLNELSEYGWENIVGNTWYKTLYENGNTELCLIINPFGENHESDFILDLKAKDRLVNTNFSMSVKSLNDIIDTLRKLGILRNRRW